MKEIDYNTIPNGNLILTKGREIEPRFKICEDQREYYTDLYEYFAGTSQKYSFDRGLLISGDVGTGKTLSIQIMQRVFGGFRIVSARHLIREFLQSKVNGMDILDLYGRHAFTTNGHGHRDLKKPIYYCFDDLGLEEVNSKMYGNQQNVLAEILLDRYEIYRQYGVKTFATTNLKADKIEELYGIRVRDRMREMMNYCTLIGNSKRI